MRTTLTAESDSETGALVSDIYEAAGALRRCGETMAAAVGQAQAGWQLLKAIHEGQRTVPHASRRLGVRRQAVQRVARELLAEGLVTVESNPNHKNSPLMVLTDRGAEQLRQMTALADEWREKVDEGLDPQDVATTRRVLATLVAAC